MRRIHWQRPQFLSGLNNRNLEARLISEFSTISPGHLYTLAVQLEPEENWHTYWVNPGDSGTATQIQWQGPEGSYFDANSVATSKTLRNWPVGKLWLFR